MCPAITKTEESVYEDALSQTEHRSYPRPDSLWRLRQRWRDLLFAHWPIATEHIQRLLPAGLVADTFDGFAWIGVVPFWMDQVHSRVAGQHTVSTPGASSFNELNLRTYVRSRATGQAGVFFFSLDCDSPLSVVGARTLFHLPYFFASIQREDLAEGIAYQSRRLLTRQRALVDVTYRSVGPVPAPTVPPANRAFPHQSLEAFLTERYCLFTPFFGRLLVGEIHHLPWPLQPAEAEFRVNDLPAAHGILLPKRPPVLHFAKELYVSLWGLHPDGPGTAVKGSVVC